MFFLTVVILSCFSIYGGSAFFNADRVINGDNATIQDFPYQCSLQKLENHACGCSIYNNKVLLTAAHCVSGATQSDINHMQVRCGSPLWSSGGVLKKVKEIIVHPEFYYETMANDIAVIKISSPLVFSNSIKPIELAMSPPVDGSPVIISGWGYKKEDLREMTPMLQKTTVNYISGKECSSSLYKYLGEIKPGMCCGISERSDACQGDSGGPLIDRLINRQVGIVSWGYGCAKPGYPGIYSSVPYFRDWIKKTADAM